MKGDLIFGLIPVREALGSGRSVTRVYFAKESRADAFRQVVAQAKAQSVPFDFVPQAKLNALTGTHDHQGVAAKISPIEYVALGNFLASCPACATVLVLDQIQHPKNLGLLVRTALGAGVHGVVQATRHTASVDASVIRASAGAVFKVPLVRSSNLSQALKRLKSEGFWLYGLDAHGGENVFELPWPDRCAFVVGNESRGLRPMVKKACDAIVRIPMSDELESLNVAVAAGIAMFQRASKLTSRSAS